MNIRHVRMNDNLVAEPDETSGWQLGGVYDVDEQSNGLCPPPATTNEAQA